MGDITHVLISHMHADHVAGATRVAGVRRVPSFPNARYYVMENEWRHALEPWNPLPDLIEAQMVSLSDAGVVTLVRDEQEVAPGVTLIPAPGESPGHAIVRLLTDDAVVYYLGDLFHHPAEFLHLIGSRAIEIEKSSRRHARSFYRGSPPRTHG
jgi:glyoxylase-like metal-dependent hydrolase (beta-lactamase superfamily II)